ncbi:hypothetical protein BaRGS_00035700 [Batillaria attramentaria]|uniref:Phosphatidylinositol transfer protein N-terminal domain-containing protein n=1 Tax=Batillaria attramentaria TaxID=370345 RepID=A0ABD0JDY4_9CAEN
MFACGLCTFQANHRHSPRTVCPPRTHAFLYTFKTVIRSVTGTTLSAFNIAHLWTVLEISKGETGGGEGVEILANEPFSVENNLHKPYEPLKARGQEFTEGHKVSRFIRALVPKGLLHLEEECWNAYPYTRTVLTNPAYMKDDFFIRIDSFCVENDTGQLENVHELTKEELGNREVHHLDISDNSAVPRSDYKRESDPTKCRSKKGRGPLPADTCVKGQQGGWTQNKRLCRNVHRQLYCGMDTWDGMTLEDVRKYEEQSKRELDELRRKGKVRGMTSDVEAEEARDRQQATKQRGCCCFRSRPDSASVHPSS